MTRTAAVLLTLVLTAQLAGCAGAAAGGAPGVRRNSNLITAEELQEPALVSLTLYDAIQRIRPSWLRARGATSVMGAGDQFAGVMINDAPSQMDALRSLRATDVTTAEFLSGADATTLYGTGYVNGLIRVRTGGMR